MKLVPFEVISSACNALVLPFQELLEGLMEVLLWERINDLQILDETDCISHSTNTLGEGMNPIILPPAMGK